MCWEHTECRWNSGHFVVGAYNNHEDTQMLELISQFAGNEQCIVNYQLLS